MLLRGSRRSSPQRPRERERETASTEKPGSQSVRRLVALFVLLFACSTGVLVYKEALLDPVSLGASTEMVDYAAATAKYFEVWNSKDLGELRKLFADGATLRDWDVEKAGADEVVAANGGIFEAVPAIKIDVLKVHISESTLSTISEIHVVVSAEETLKVTDIITFDGEGLITSVRAYKG